MIQMMSSSWKWKCRLVRYRLEHENLKEEEYEKLLFPCFEKMKARLPVGFAVFRVPYVRSGIDRQI
ncbi:MAG: hypothetical protein ACLTNW_16785 [Mediterraneibacter gnavus]